MNAAPNGPWGVSHAATLVSARHTHASKLPPPRSTRLAQWCAGNRSAASATARLARQADRMRAAFFLRPHGAVLVRKTLPMYPHGQVDTTKHLPPGLHTSCSPSDELESVTAVSDAAANTGSDVTSERSRSPPDERWHRVAPLTMAEALEWIFYAPPAPPSASTPPTSTNGHGALSRDRDRSACRLFIGDLGVGVSEPLLAAFLSRFGNVAYVCIKRDSMTSRSLGFGFVEYSTAAEAEHARIQAHGAWLGSRRIRLGTAYHRQHEHELVVHGVPDNITTDALHRSLAAAYGARAFDANGTYVITPRRLGWLQHARPSMARIRFVHQTAALTVLRAGTWRLAPNAEVCGPVEYAPPPSICRNAVEVQFLNAAQVAEQLALWDRFRRFGAVVQQVYPMPRRCVAYVVYEANARGVAAAKRAMRCVFSVQGRRVWCHPCKVAAEVLMAMGAAWAAYSMGAQGNGGGGHAAPPPCVPPELLVEPSPASPSQLCYFMDDDGEDGGG
eukprot:ctg_335.g124